MTLNMLPFLHFFFLFSFFNFFNFCYNAVILQALEHTSNLMPVRKELTQVILFYFSLI